VSKFEICLIGLKCYDLLAGAASPRLCGGTERQQVFLARGLVARGHRVSFVTLDHGQPDGVEHDAIRCFKAYDVDSGWPGIRFVHPRWIGMAGAMRRARARIYYQMGADSETGQVAAWCQWHRRRFVFTLASDGDCDPALPLLRTRRQRALYRYGIRRADAVIAQTDVQHARLRDAFKTDSVVIRNCAADVAFDASVFRTRAENKRPRLLWVGRFVPVKRLELLFDLAAAHPEWEFHVAGDGDGSQAYVRQLQSRSATLPNVSMHRWLDPTALHEQYLHAHALICTSSWEGVPTTFLEAWARGLPVISTIDPDGVIAAQDLGLICGPDGLTDAVLQVMTDRGGVIGARGRAHFLANHTIDAFVMAHEKVFEQVLAGSPSLDVSKNPPSTEGLITGL
jgi:glycosyltransferase involved in cell wall biosynthesis